MQPVTNPQLKLAHDFVQYTNRNVFLTGKAGTGKTTFLRRLKEQSPKRMVVVAPTGVAAINAGGVTIHSFFQMPFGPILPSEAGGINDRMSTGIHRFSKDKINIIKTLDLLVIDEISMVRADLLDGIDQVLRRFRRRDLPFGGVQLLLIGDLQQLPPVVKDEEWRLLRSYYHTAFFFGSRALRQTDYVSIELRHIFRQQDENFIGILNQVRDNILDAQSLQNLNQRYVSDRSVHEEQGYITLTTHNYQARQINEVRLNKLKSPARKFRAVVQGNFPPGNFPTDEQLILKVGAQVMFVKNDISPAKLYYNGKIGKVTLFDKSVIYVKCPGEEEPIAVKADEWQNTKYSIDDNTKEIKEEVEGIFRQYPLKTAWAITIHKSQGLTFDKAIIDANAAFAHGQVYVALSRCRTLEGLVLSRPLTTSALRSDEQVSAFNRNIEDNPPDEQTLVEARHAYQRSVIHEMFDFGPIVHNLNYCLKISRENKGAIQGRLPNVLTDIELLMKSQLIEVAAKFLRQADGMLIQNPDAQNNPVLQERIKKACGWFLNKMRPDVALVLSKTPLETDNRAVEKTIKGALERLETGVHVKVACFEACSGGFSVKKYLTARAEALIDASQAPRLKKKKQEVPDLPEEAFTIYNRLKSWRSKKAKELNYAAYMVLPTKSIIHLSAVLPASMKELKAIHGLGPAKLKQFGVDILEMVLQYREEKGMDLPSDEDKPFEIPPNPPKNPKIDTKKVSLDLFNAGTSIKDIARAREMVESTIEGHLVHFVRMGEVDVNKIVSPSKVEAISAWISEHPSESLSVIKAHFGDGTSWSDIKMVRAHLHYLQK